MTPNRAVDIATNALIWLCADEDNLPVFLAASGAGADDLRAALTNADGPDTGLLAAALDFVLMRDDTVIACAAACDLPPEQLQMAAQILAGPGAMHWT